MVAAQNRHQLVRLGRDFWVQDYQTAVNALKHESFPAHIQPLAGEF